MFHIVQRNLKKTQNNKKRDNHSSLPVFNRSALHQLSILSPHTLTVNIYIKSFPFARSKQNLLNSENIQNYNCIYTYRNITILNVLLLPELSFKNEIMFRLLQLLGIFLL